MQEVGIELHGRFNRATTDGYSYACKACKTSYVIINPDTGLGEKWFDYCRNANAGQYVSDK